MAEIVDLVGWGGANFFEGSGSAAETSNTTAFFRLDAGLVDTDNNLADFIIGAPNPRNTRSPLNSAAGAVPLPPTLILVASVLFGLAIISRRQRD